MGSVISSLTGLLYRSSTKESHQEKRKTGRIPVYIITGFLGSGKTTCINQILNSASEIRFGVIVNDFGSICIDRNLIDRDEGQIIALENGCICCSLKKSLSEAVVTLVDSDGMPDILVIEASGVAEPAGIINLLECEELQKKVRIAGVICLVDAEGISSVSWIMSHLVRKQIRSADLILLNKVDRVSQSRKAAIRKDWIPSDTPLLETSYGAIPISVILGTARNRSSGHPSDGEHTGHFHHDGSEHGFSTISWTHSSPIHLSCLRAVMKNLPPTVIRAKGLAYSSEFPTEQVIIQVVGKRVSITKGRPWTREHPSTRLIFIGHGDTVQNDDISARLHSCLAKNARSVPKF